MKTHLCFKPGSLAIASVLFLTGFVVNIQAQAQSAQGAPSATVTPVKKDIVADTLPVQPTTKPRRFTSAAHDTATSGALAELGLDLMRQQSAATGNAQVNAVVSPLSLVSALGMVHAGTAGATARELASLLGSASAGERVYTTRMPVLLEQLTKPGAAGTPFVMANRVWLDSTVVAAIPASYAAAVTSRFNADAAMVQFAQATLARKTINAWVSQKTASRIAELMPEGSITPNTKLVVTNAIHFKSKWAEPFNTAQTVPKPFQTAPNGPTKPVPTMVDERQVRLGLIDNLMVMELPFAGQEFSLMVAVPPAGHTLNALETDLEGLDMASWSAQLKPTTCRLELPKFSIEPATRPLKASLQALGVKTVFSSEADLEPMLGRAGKGVALDNVYQSATIIIDEQGAKPLPPPVPPWWPKRLPFHHPPAR
ncbi:MAG: serpin family protein [Comamonadaceae bacterium]|nr:serpin family protein [Comamonadaceae bacterium]